jgi:hypothetical protein
MVCLAKKRDSAAAGRGVPEGSEGSAVVGYLKRKMTP